MRPCTACGNLTAYRLPVDGTLLPVCDNSPRCEEAARIGAVVLRSSPGVNCTRCRKWTEEPDATGLCRACHDYANCTYPVDGWKTTSERPSDDVLRIVHAFGDAGRKAEVRALAARVKANEDELDALRRDCAQMSEELGLPPTIRPAEGELRRMQQALERVGAALRHVRAVRDGVVEPLVALRRIENVLTVPHVHPSNLKEILSDEELGR